MQPGQKSEYQLLDKKEEGEQEIAYYFIVDTYIKGEHPGAYNEYISEVRPIVESFGGEYLVRTNEVDSLNAQRHPQRSIVIKFPSKELLEICFASAEYKAIMMKRADSVDSRAIIVPGVEEENEDPSDKN